MSVWNLEKLWDLMARSRMAEKVARDLAGPQAREGLLADAGYPAAPEGLISRLEPLLAQALPLMGLDHLKSFGGFFDGPALLEAARAEARQRLPEADPRGPIPSSRLELDGEAEYALWPWISGQASLRLARASLLSSDDDLLLAAFRSIRDTARDNPPLMGPGWMDLGAVALRAVNWLLALRFMGRLRALDKDVLLDALVHLRVAGLVLDQGLEQGGEEPAPEQAGWAGALLFLGKCLSFLPEAPGWLERASLRMTPALASLDEPGPPLPGGALSALCQWAALALWLTRGEEPGAPGLLEETARLAALCRVNASPLGAGFFWGWTPADAVLDLHPERRQPFGLGPNLAAVLTSMPEIRAGRALDEAVFWFLGPEADQKLRLLAGGALPPPTDLPGAGLTFLAAQSAGKKVSLLLRTSPRLEGAGLPERAEALALALALDGIGVLHTPGPPGSGPLAGHLQSRAAHNALRVDGREPGPGVVEVEACEQTPSYSFLSASFDGYGNLEDPVRIRRRLYLDPGRGHLDVVDQIQGAAEHTLESFFHFPPGVQIKEDQGGVLVVTGPFGRLLMKLESGVRVSVAMGRSNPPLGWLATAPGRVEPAPVVCLTARAAGSARISTVLVWGEKL